MNKFEYHQPNIRSYTLRQRGITPAQRRAFDAISTDYLLNPEKQFCTYTGFSRNAPVIVEIGFGDGDNLVSSAETYPENNYLGIEVYRPGIGHLMMQLRYRNIANVRIYWADAIDILQHNIPDASVDRVNLYFPDPWPKKRHHKRRLVTPEFASIISAKLKPGGCFHAATDWENYAVSMRSILEHCQYLINVSGKGRYADRTTDRNLTKFEKKGIRLGNQVRDLIFERI